MFELFVVIVFALVGFSATGLIPDQAAIDPPGAAPGAAPEKGQTATPVQVAEPTPATTDSREPEPQVPTGQFTTAVEVKPILEMTKPQWIALRDYEGQDLLYFTQLLSWRCGLWDIRYGLNGAPATEILPLEPCHVGTASPNALTSVDYPIYLEFPQGSVAQVTVAITFDDGTMAEATYDRAQVLMP